MNQQTISNDDRFNTSIESNYESIPYIREILADIAFLTQTETRLEILTLLKNEPYSCNELQQLLNIHRTTLRRNLRQLDEKNYIQEIPTENCYRLSRMGNIVTDRFWCLVQEIHTMKSFGPFLNRFSKQIELDAEVLFDCSIAYSTEQRPYAPRNAFLDIFQGTATIYGIVPIMTLQYLEPMINEVQKGTSVELIGSADVYDRLRVDYPSAIEVLSRKETVRLFIADEVPSFGIGLTDDDAFIAAFNDSMRTHSVVTANGSQRVIRWVKHQYKSCKQTAVEYD